MQMDNKSACPTGPECLSPDIASAFATLTKGTPQFQHRYGKNAGLIASAMFVLSKCCDSKTTAMERRVSFLQILMRINQESTKSAFPKCQLI